MNPYLAGALVLACVAAGWVVGVVLYDRLLARRVKEGDSDAGLTDAVAFVGGAFGIILGLLLVFAVQHFADARAASREEAASAVGLFNGAGPFAADERSDLRRDLLCYMRSVSSDDWEAARQADLTGAENTSAWAGEIQSAVENLTITTDAQSEYYYFVTERTLTLDSDRAIRLQLALPEIPLAIWLVILVCAFAFITLLSVHLGPRRRLRAVTVSVSTLVLLAVVMSLAALDEPYTGTTATVTPVAMESALLTLQDSFPEEDWSPCPQLAENSLG